MKTNHLWVFGIQLSKTHKINTKIKKPSTWTTQNLILIHWLHVSCSPGKWTKTRPGKSNKTTMKSHVRGYCLCSHASKTHAFYHSSRENFRKKSKNQKVKNFSTFRLFDFSNVSFFFVFFRLFEQKSPGMGTFRLFDVSTSRARKSWFSRCDRYQPEEHTEYIDMNGTSYCSARPCWGASFERLNLATISEIDGL